MWTLPLQEHPGLALYVIERMRDWDRREIFATPAFEPTNEGLLEAVMATGDLAWIAGEGDEPIAIYGCNPLWRGVWSMWFLATASINKIGFSLTRLVKKGIVPELFRAGAHRLECRSMDGHEEAQRWLRALGAEREATARGFGQNREDFHVYVWLSGGE